MTTLNLSDWEDRIQHVNTEANGSIRHAPDDVTWGVDDRWDLPKNWAEDCDGYVLYKALELFEIGFPKECMCAAICYNEKGEGHLVLCLIFEEGDLILDNRTNMMLWWDVVCEQGGYRFIARSQPDKSIADPWEYLG